MAWLDSAVFAVISVNNSVSVDWERRSVRSGYFLPFTEQRRTITTTVTEQVEDARGLERSVALAQAASAPAMSGDEDDNTTVIYSAARANEADGWTATKTTTRRQVTRTDWEDV